MNILAHAKRMSAKQHKQRIALSVFLCLSLVWGIPTSAFAQEETAPQTESTQNTQSAAQDADPPLMQDALSRPANGAVVETTESGSAKPADGVFDDTFGEEARTENNAPAALDPDDVSDNSEDSSNGNPNSNPKDSLEDSLEGTSEEMVPLAGEITVTDEASLRAALTTGTASVVKLDGDITLSNTTILEVGTAIDYALDLNGHTLLLNVNKNPVVMVPQGAHLTIINNATTHGIIKRGTSHEVLIENRGTLTIGNGVAADGEEVILDGGYENGNGVTAAECLLWNSAAGAVLTLRAGGIIQQNCNNSANPAGGVRVNSFTEFYMTGGEIRNCRTTNTASSGTSGGGVYVNGYFEMSGGSIHNCVAVTRYGFFTVVGSGGGVAILSGDTSASCTYKTALFLMTGGTIYDNEATNGGGVWTSSNANSRFYMRGGTIEHNTARYGAGVQNNSCTVSAACALDGQMSGTLLAAGTIQDNVASYYGGGVENDIASSNGNPSAHIVVRSNMNIMNNRAPSGAGLSFRGTAASAQENLIDGALITGNSATSNGGGIYITGRNTRVTIKNMSEATNNALSNNQAVNAALTGGNGGGIYSAATDGTITIENVTLIRNRAGANGSGAYVANGTVNFINSKIKENAECANGGGLYVTGSSTKVTLGERSLIVGNRARTSGGGVYLASGSFAMTSTGNPASNPLLYGNVASEVLAAGSSADDVRAAGGTLQLLQADNIKLPGIRIIGWFDDETTNRYRDEVVVNTEHVVTTGTQVNTPAHLTLGYALVYSVMYEGNGATSGVPSDTAEYTEGTLYTVLDTVPVRDGYTFTGWLRTDNSLIYQGDSTFTMPGHTVTLVAQWEEIPVTTPPSTDEPPNIPPNPTPNPNPSTTTPTTFQDESGTPSIVEESIPLDNMSGSAAWALVNLILCVLGVLAALVAIVRAFLRRSDEKEDGEARRQQAEQARHAQATWQAQTEQAQAAKPLRSMQASQEHEQQRRKQSKHVWLIIMILLAIAGVVVFLLTENMRLPMILIDQWTIVNLIIFIVEIIAMILMLRKKEAEDEEGGGKLSTSLPA